MSAADVQRLQQQVDDLLLEREVIKERVHASIRDLLFENEDLKRKVEELKGQIRRAAAGGALTRKDSNNGPTLSSDFLRRSLSEDSSKRGSLDPTDSKRTSAEELLSPNPRKDSGEKKPDGRSSTGELTRKKAAPERTNSSYNKTWKDKVKFSLKRKTIMMGKEEDDEDEDGDAEIPPSESQAPAVEEESKDLDFIEEDLPDLIFVKQEGSNKMPIVKAGSPQRLIERLAPEKYADTDYLSHFLLTYRSFTTPDAIFDTLSNLFHPVPLENATQEEIEEFNKKQAPVRLRVTNALKTWLGKKHAYDIENDAIMIEKIQGLIEAIAKSGISAQADLLRRSIDKLKEDKADNVPSTPPPKPIFIAPLNVNSLHGLSLTDLDPLECARQITLHEYSLFKVILPKECLNQAWVKKEKETLAPNVLKMIHWSNDVSGWVISEVLSRDQPKQRADIIKLFLKIAKHCKDLNNFNAVFEILAGLQSSPVDRLRKTWEKIDKVYKQMHKELQLVNSRDKNFSVLRDLLKQSLPPCIPYLGMFLTDLTFIDTGNLDRIPKTDAHKEELVNFVKLRKTALVIKQIQLFQNTGYSLAQVLPIQDYFHTFKATNITESEAFKKSLLLEPREPQQ